MTNPTGKNRFEAGKNGRIVKESATTKLVENDLTEVLIADHEMAVTKVNNKTVDKFRMSKTDLTNGTVLIVQSHIRSQGHRSSQAFKLA